MATRTTQTALDSRRRAVPELGYLMGNLHGLLLRPNVFIEELPGAVPVRAALLLALVCIEVSTIVAGILMLAGVDGIQGAAYGAIYLAGLITGQELVGTELTVTGLVAAVLLAPVTGAVMLLIFSVMAHSLVVLVVGERNRGFRATVTVVALSSVVTLVNWLPAIGLPLNVYGAVIAALGIRRLHGAAAWRAGTAAALPVAAMLLFFILLVVLPE